MTASTLEPGLRIGKYEVVAHIASGGMGAVYKAIDRELDRPVALKVMAARLAENRRGLDRFKREARSAAKLSHPNIVTLYDCDYDQAHNLHFLAMEFVEGIDLAEHIRRKGQLSPEETRRILIQAVKALDHAFRQGIIHRDIKPSNFLLTRLGDKAVVKLTDMGLAVQNDDEQRVTGDGNTVGTLDYMSPEQARDSRGADVRSDIYSLGCTAYHMLAGKPPFPDGGVGERLFKHLNVPPPDVREFNPAVSVDFWTIIEKMLAKEPDNRFATPAELLTNLKRTSTEASPDAPTMLDISTRRKTDVDPAPPSETYQSTPPAVQMRPRKSKTPTPAPKTDDSGSAPARPRARKMPKQMRVLVGIAAGLCLLVIGGPLLLESVRSFATRATDEPVKKGAPNGPGPADNQGIPFVNVAVPQEQPGDASKNPNKSVGSQPALSKEPKNKVVIIAPIPKDPVVANPTPKGTGRSARDSIIPFSAIARPEKLEEIRAVQIRGIRPMSALPPRELEFVLSWESLKRLKYEYYERGVSPTTQYVLLIGKHGWTTAPGPRTLTGDALDSAQNAHYATMVSSLIPLTEIGFEMEKGDASQVDGKDCFTILVKRTGRPTLKLYFENSTKLLYKIDYQTKLLDPNRKYAKTMTNVELFFSDFRSFDGLKHWKKQEIAWNGVKVGELQITDFKTYTSADNGLFTTPGWFEAEVFTSLLEEKMEMIKRVVFELGGNSSHSNFCRLVHGLSHSDPTLRSEAHEARCAYADLWRKGYLAKFVAKDAPCLILLLRPDEDPELATFALEGVSFLGVAAAMAVPNLKTLVQESPDPSVKSRAILALGKTGAKNEAPFLEKYIDNPVSQIKDAAALALLRLAPNSLSPERLTEFMTRPNKELRGESAAQLLPRMTTITPKEVGLLAPGVRHASTDIQITFIDFIGSLKQPGTGLVQVLSDRLRFKGDPDVALHTVRALENMGKAAEQALPDLATTIDGTNKPLAVAAAIAVCKIDAGNSPLKNKAVVCMLLNDLTPDPSDLEASMLRAPKSRSAATLLEMGEPAVPQVVAYLLNGNNPAMNVKYQGPGPTAARWVGYELLKEFAKQAQASGDKTMIQTLRKQSNTKFWSDQELKLAKSSGFAQVYAAAAESSRQAHAMISKLHVP